MTIAALNCALKQYIDPFLGQDLFSAKVVKLLTDKTLKLQFGFPVGDIAAQITAAVQAALPQTLDIQISTVIKGHVGQKSLNALPQIKNIIVVASGKGGVGKSTTAVNLALALSKMGARTGLLDADIYGPSVPLMMGLRTRPEFADKTQLKPIIRHGLQTMSIGYLIGEKAPMVWRGPMVSTAVQQLIHDTLWDNLDYLIVDLPPGTGDIQLTLAQKIPLSAAVVVTTPQDLALIDAARAVEMFQKVQIPVLGIIENMAMHICSACGHNEAIFGEQGGDKFAEQYALPLLGRLPLDKKIRADCDAGSPTATTEGAITSLYVDIARRLSAKLSLEMTDYSHNFTNVVIKN